MCGGGVYSILLLPLVAWYLETIDVCTVYMVHVCFYIRCSDCVGICRNFYCVVGIAKDCDLLALKVGVVKYVVCLCRGCDGCCVFCYNCVAWSCRCSCMGNMSV